MKKVDKYKLERESDGLIKTGNNIIWVEWQEDGSYKQKHQGPIIGASLVLDFFGCGGYTWMTTAVTQIDSTSEDLITFKTQNSLYKLYIN
jgi:hypothetical protein